jgi:hypothetical protein
MKSFWTVSRNIFRSGVLRRSSFDFNLFLPLLSGGLIYLFFREVKPPVVAEALGLLNLEIDYVFFTNLRHPLWLWFVYSMPDALWAYSLTYFILFVTKNDGALEKIVYRAIGYLLIILQEILQGSMLKGTYDVCDLISLNSAILFCYFVFNRLEANNGKKAVH